MTFIERKRYFQWIFVGSLFLLLGLMVLSSTLGVAEISFVDALKIIAGKIPLIKDFFDEGTLNPIHTVIVWKVRLPRIILAALVGAGLSLVGGAFQGLFKNPLADPYVLGIPFGAALGATIAIVLGIQAFFFGLGFTVIAAFIGAITTTLLVYSIARIGNKIPTITLLLAGIAVGFFFSSLISLMMILNQNQMEEIVFWMMGSVSAAGWHQVMVMFPFIATGSGLLLFYSRELNVMATGDETARSLGIEVEKVKKILLFIASIIVAACVSVSGIIGFVGLIIPHVIRILLGADHRVVLPMSAIGGAIFLVFCDTLARNVIPPGEIPVGVITALFGAPFFIYLLIKRKREVL